MPATSFSPPGPSTANAENLRKAAGRTLNWIKGMAGMAGKMVQTEAPLARDAPYQFFATTT